MGGGPIESLHGTTSNDSTTDLAHGLVVEPSKATRKALGGVAVANLCKVSSQPVVPSSQGSLPSSILMNNMISRPASASVGSGPRLHKLMQLQLDKLDLSFVEKVIIPPGEISNLCNDILSGSAPAAKSNLNFASLNERSMHVIGLYGSKKVLVDIFMRLKFSSIASLLMEDASVDPGMYGFLHNKVLYVFYWHQGPRLQEASRKDVSCNFIRYVADLCGTVYVCLDAEDFEAPLMTNADSRAASVKRRTQRIQISVDKQSEDDIRLENGFHICPKEMKKAKPRNYSRSWSGSGQETEFRLVSGLQRCGVMTSRVVLPKKVDGRKQIDVKEQDLPGRIEKWRQEYDIDVIQLPDADLEHFVLAGGLEGREQYEELLESFVKRRDDHRNRFYLMDKLVEQEEANVLNIFTRAQEAYLQQTHPWEEALVHFVLDAGLEGREQCIELLKSFDKRRDDHQNRFYVMDTLVKQEEENVLNIFTRAQEAYLQQTHPWEEDLKKPSLPTEASNPEATFSGAGMEEREMSATPSTDPSADLMWVANKELSKLWTSTGSNDVSEDQDYPLLVFPGTEVMLVSETEEFVGDFILAATSTARSNVGPFLYGQEFIATSKEPRPGTKYMVTSTALDRDCPTGPLLTCRFMRYSSKPGGERIVKMVCRRPSAHGMSEWVASHGTTVPDLRKTAVHLSWLIANPSETFGAGTSVVVLQKVQDVLNGTDVLGEFRTTLTDEIGRLLEKARPDQLPEAQKNAFESLDRHQVELVFDLCRRVYSVACSELTSKLAQTVKKVIVPMIREKMQFERPVHADNMEEDFKVELSNLLQKLRRNLSGGNKHSRTLKVTRCSPQKVQASTPWNSRSCNWVTELLPTKLRIDYVYEETVRKRITWEMAELTPMKKDIDELLLQGSHVITPECSPSSKLIEMDTCSEKLFLVYPVKSGELLVFVEKIFERSIDLYMIPKLGSEVKDGNRIKTFKRGVDLVAVDESSKLLAFYDKEMTKVSVYGFDENFRHFDYLVDPVLSKYEGVQSLTSMMFIPGKREIVLVDTAWKVRVLEIRQPVMLRRGHISLTGPDHKICISSEGFCLLVFYRSTSTVENLPSSDTAGSSEREVTVEDEAEVVATDVEPFLKMEVYLLDDRMSHLKTINLEYSIPSIGSLQVGTLSYGSQAHLVLLDTSRPDKGIWSKVVQISSATEVCRFQTVEKNRELNTPVVQTNQRCPALEYMHLIFEKFATSPPLMPQARELTVQLVLGDGPPLKRSQFKEKCALYLTSAIERLKGEKGKDFSQLQLTIPSDCVDVESCIADGVLLGSTAEGTSVTAGDWARLLVCLVPIQIARAENNSLRPMIDGLQMPASVIYEDAGRLAAALRFGFYDAVLSQWPGPIKVISSMGKQSSGKSYLLNHLSGSLLDVSGGRCTDGVWMTMRASRSECPNCLYVLLDFEGLGSFERSEQEDMLLSVFNAAVSSITIFNKKDFHLDRETEAVFERFQNGVSLVKQDRRLFKGLFYMAIKDVDTSDVEELKKEFRTKIMQICCKSKKDNFLMRMYGGLAEIDAMPPFDRPQYHKSVAGIADTVKELPHVHQSGSRLRLDLKLVIAQISARDWSPIDSKRVALKVDLIRTHVSSAIKLGHLVSQTENSLVNFETDKEIPDFLVVVDGQTFDLGDSGLELSPSQESRAVGDVLQTLRNYFQRSHKRCGPDHDDKLWHSTFGKFLMALADRRRKRILEWLICNTIDFQDDGDVRKLRLETDATLAELEQSLSLCRSKCESCFFHCVLEKSHPAGTSHSCRGLHSCANICTFCVAEGLTDSEGLKETQCGNVSGHEGSHACRTKRHTCGQECSFQGKSSNCNTTCCLKVEHDELQHICNTKDHKCNKKCSSSGCENWCTISLADANGDHDRHICHERRCPRTCMMRGCKRICGSEDHFHSLTSEAHFCGDEHSCGEVCQAPGICEVVTGLVRELKTFKGKRGEFEYELVSEQNGKKKQCCIPIPPWRDTHDGDHCHTTLKDVVHFCETKCAACGYFCDLSIGHTGLHKTTHGNMRAAHFAAEEEDIDLEGRKYSCGESGIAEMCMMHCKARGRGHIHLIRCEKFQEQGACAQGLLEGARHETQEYGPDKKVPKDELSHAAFWEHMRFQDPCQEDDKKQFALCNHHCRSSEHKPATGSTNAAQWLSYCTEKLWHAPVSRTGLGSSSGYVTEDGHSFSCNHGKHAANHVVFIIDRSGSMAKQDVSPQLVKFYKTHKNRLGCVYEAILRFIETRIVTRLPDVVSVVLFDGKGFIAVERQPIAENIVDGLLQHFPGRGSAYSSGLSLAEQVLQRASQDSSMEGKHPTVVFLSDGRDKGATKPVSIIKKMHELDSRLVFHTILLGKDNVNEEILKAMATAGNGTYQVSMDEVQLARNFENLAKCLRPKVAALMY